MPYIKTDNTILMTRRKRYVFRIFVMRQVGSLLCFMSIASVLYFLNYQYEFYVLLAFNALIWPLTAYVIAMNSSNVVRSTNISLIIDGALGGFWIAMVQLSPFPSLILLAILISDRYAAGGWKILRPSLIALFITLIMVWGLAGFKLNLALSPQMVWWSLPLATIYLMSLSVLTRNLAIQLIDKNHEYERIALIDPRLQIPNRRLFEQRLATTFAQTQNSSVTAHLMLLDVDYFKHINDNYGHDEGDYFLSQMSDLLRQMSGPEDTPARFGGDELAIIVMNRSDEDVIQLAQNIQAAVQQIRLSTDSAFFTTVSIGIASSESAQSVSDWFGVADKALYLVKRHGRNGIQLF
ncbi:diguanylate cyclase [Acinetobacter soli]|uniref:sensor domain-containing diguanylate cyclase n=1 Tax=Acinetobacter soli TaxID=487316 RepID=UPI00287ECA23|nr:diguanylate cyclase [Acinetobacter soli]MDS7693717.1 diguanylate cyclase [Acinetobacter soli]